LDYIGDPESKPAIKNPADWIPGKISPWPSEDAGKDVSKVRKQGTKREPLGNSHWSSSKKTGERR